MLNPGVLIHRSLQEAKGHLAKGGRLIMPFSHLAGPTNDPGIQGTAARVYRDRAELHFRPGWASERGYSDLRAHAEMKAPRYFLLSNTDNDSATAHHMRYTIESSEIYGSILALFQMLFLVVISKYWSLTELLDGTQS